MSGLGAVQFKLTNPPLMATSSSIKERENSQPYSNSPSITDKIRNSRVLILGGTGRVGGSTAFALSQLSPDLRIVVGGRNREKGAEVTKKLGEKSRFVEVDITDVNTLDAALEDVDLVVHTAGPFQQAEKCSVLEAAIRTKTAYIDVCDDSSYAFRAKSYCKEAEAANIPAITTAGIYPGVSNVMAAELVRAAREKGESEPERLRFSYYTAGTGGAGPTILSTSFLLLGEDVIAYKNGQKIKLKPYSGMVNVDFGMGIKKKDVFLLNLPEVRSTHEVLGIPTVSARFGTSPFFWNWGMSIMTNLLSPEFLTDRNKVQQLVELFDPVVRAVDGIAGERVSVRVDLECSDGRTTVGIFSHKRLSVSVGVSTAAFVLAVLEGSTQPGVWFPEEPQGIAVEARKILLESAAQGTFNFAMNKGNQAYANGDIKKAEEFYTQGLSCIPRHETSRDCLRSLVLCYSNRAAARMSTGRMSEALQDCLVAAEIDPNFFRVQLRAANCYLALGKLGNASRYFKQLLQSTDVCVERKIILEASDGLQKAQKVSECMDRSTSFLQQKTIPDIETALEIIAEALVISPYSEQLLESKAEALFMLRRYEEVIQLCEETLEAAEKNHPISDADELLPNVDADLLEKYSFCTWRLGFIFKSNFYLGKLEEALELLDKHEKWSSMVTKCGGNETLESLIPQLSIVRELIRHKSAGNAAFQTGRHTEAVEHYSAALSFNVESRPFAAVCFGNRAAAYQALGQITDAVADCSLAIALDKNYLKAISRRATLFEMIRDYDQAAKDLERLVSLLTKQVEDKSNPSGAPVPSSLLVDLKQARQRLYQMEDQSKRGIPLNFYLILGVEPSVAATDLKKAYRKAALRHHPDKAGQSLTRSECGDDGLWKEIAEEVYKNTDKLFKMVGEAYAVLSDPTKRSQYDLEEDMRNGVKKHGNTSRMPNDASMYTEERGGAARQWREGWRTSANPYSRGFEPTRPGRYY